MKQLFVHLKRENMTLAKPHLTRNKIFSYFKYTNLFQAHNFTDKSRENVLISRKFDLFLNDILQCTSHEDYLNRSAKVLPNEVKLLKNRSNTHIWLYSQQKLEWNKHKYTNVKLIPDTTTVYFFQLLLCLLLLLLPLLLPPSWSCLIYN